MNDTRKDKRAPVSLKVRFKSATVDEFVEHYSRDISHGGLFIKSKQPMAIGTLLKFELQLKDESKLIQGVGRVVWKRDASDTATDENPAGMGIKFIKMDPESRAIVEKMVDQRGAEPGQYEAGGGDSTKEKDDDVAVGGAAATASASAARPVRSAKATMAFFPAASLTEADMPRPEDRTQVRQASEFLAAALGGGEDNLASQEAEKKAEEARKRTEEIEKEREAAAAREKAEAEAKERAEKEARDRTEREKTERAEKEAKDKADAEKKAEDDKKAAAKAEEDKKAAAAKAEEDKAAEKKAAEKKAAEKKDEPKKAEPKKDEPKKDEPKAAAKKDEPKKAEPKAAAAPVAPSEPQSNMLPIFLGVAVVVALGGYYLMSQNSTPETPPTHEVTPTPGPTPEPTPSVEPTVEPAVEPAVEPGVEPAVDPSAELVQPPPTTVTVQSFRIPSTPAGAEIFLNGERLGVAPGPFDAPVGSTVDVRLAGHREGHAVVTEGVASMPITLNAFPYAINIVTTPSGATVRVGNQTVTSPARVELPSRPTGPVRIQASLTGFQNGSTTVLVPSFVESSESLVAEAQIILTPTPVATPRTPRVPTTMMDTVEPTTMETAPAEPTMEAAMEPTMEATMEAAPQTTEAVPENPF